MKFFESRYGIFTYVAVICGIAGALGYFLPAWLLALLTLFVSGYALRLTNKLSSPSLGAGYLIMGSALLVILSMWIGCGISLLCG